MNWYFIGDLVALAAGVLAIITGELLLLTFSIGYVGRIVADQLGWPHYVGLPATIFAALIIGALVS